jgi:hypothetical protein
MRFFKLAMEPTHPLYNIVKTRAPAVGIKQLGFDGAGTEVRIH